MPENSVSDTVDPRYPIGKYRPPPNISLEDRRFAVLTLSEMPALLRAAVHPLETDRMNTPYREGGWTVRQLVHHIADSHMTAFHRIRMALTEDWPTVQPYDENAFAKLPDAGAPVEWSLELIESLHARWVMMFQGMSEDQWKSGYKHAERGPMTVEQTALLYAWHSRHHVAHIMQLRKREGW
jgi:hypothetical protein